MVLNWRQDQKMKDSEQQQIFKEWIKQHKGLFFKFIRAYAFSPQDQEDLFQEIAIQVWKSVPQFRGDSEVTTWLYRITINTAIAWARKERKRQDGKTSLNGITHFLKETNQKDSRLDWLYEEIARLNEIDRTITLLLLDGFSYKEMSAMTGISESNVGVKINRIKKKLISQSKKSQYHGV